MHRTRHKAALLSQGNGSTVSQYLSTVNNTGLFSVAGVIRHLNHSFGVIVLRFINVVYCTVSAWEVKVRWQGLNKKKKKRRSWYKTSNISITDCKHDSFISGRQFGSKKVETFSLQYPNKGVKKIVMHIVGAIFINCALVYKSFRHICSLEKASFKKAEVRFGLMSLDLFKASQILTQWFIE